MDEKEHVKTSFPRDLLSRTKWERQEYFRAYTVPHTKLKRVCAELLSAILTPLDASLIFFAGPTGVGKTKLIRLLEALLIEHSLTELTRNRGRLPFVTFEVPAPETSVFPWKSFYKRALAALGEPLIEHKIRVPERPEQGSRPSLALDTSDLGEPDAGTSVPRRLARAQPHSCAVDLSAQSSYKVRIPGRGGVDDFRIAFENALIHRRPLVSILDEGHHFMRVANGSKLEGQLEIIKSVANMSEVPHLLVGTYKLIPFLDLTGQLSRRTTIIHLPRYLNTVEEDTVLFANVVRVFQRHLPLAEKPDLIGQIEYLYKHSLGCVGVLKDWLGRALAIALDEDAPTLTKAHLAKRALTPKQCRLMLSDAKEGEEYFMDADKQSALLDLELGVPPAASRGPAASPPDDTGVPPRKTRPFQRKPGRDPVGGEDERVP